MLGSRFNSIGFRVERRSKRHARWILRLPGLAALLVSLFLAGCSGPTDRDKPPPPTLELATLNLAHGRALSASQFALPTETIEANIDACADAIARAGPDIIALQEADAVSVWSGTFHHVRRIALRSALPHVHHGIHFDQGIGPIRVAYGTALLSRRELRSPTSVRFAFGHLHTKGFVTARVEFAERSLLVVSVHLTSGSAGARRREVDVMVDNLASVDVPIVLMGDLNSRWENESDAVRLLAKRLGLRAFQPDSAEHFTFRAGHPRKRIDWILIAPALEFVQYRTWTDRVSDHLGVSATIRWVQ